MKSGAGHGSEAMGTHLIFGKAHISKSYVYGILRHWPSVQPFPRENKVSFTVKGLKVLILPIPLQLAGPGVRGGLFSFSCAGPGFSTTILPYQSRPM